MITKADIERYTLKSIDTSFDGSVNSWINQVITHIETVTGRELTQTAEITRLFDGNGQYEMTIGDFVDLASVTVDGSTKEVITYPANKDLKYKIYTAGGFTRGRQNVAVTAKFGYAVIPADLDFAILVMVSGIVNNQVHNVKSSESIGNYSVSFATDAQRDDFKRAMSTLQMYRIHPL